MDIVERLRTVVNIGNGTITPLRIEAADEIERLREALQLGAEMRNAQKAYFKDRNQENLIKSKQAEKMFDAALKDKE